MSKDELAAPGNLRLGLGALYDELKDLHGGVAVLYTEAALAALENHIRKQRLSLSVQLAEGADA